MSAPTRSPAGRVGLRARLRRHMYSLFSSLGSLMANPLGTLMTVTVLGVAMVLPLALHLAVSNLQVLEPQKERWASISVFLSPGMEEQAVMALAERIRIEKGARVDWITPDQGMQEFRQASGFAVAMDLFEENPLPWVLVVMPVAEDELDMDEATVRLATWLEKQAGVDFVQTDYKWLQRLDRLIDMADALFRVLVIVFSLAVIVVVANTIRLDVSNRADEIEVLHLVGAPGRFISQPFLYAGLWYGVLGATFAVLMLSSVVFYLHGPMSRLVEAYGNALQIQGAGLAELATALLLGGALGMAGSWLAVRAHLRHLRLDPMPRRS